MIVCNKCFMAIESREGNQIHKHVESIEEIPQELIVNEDEESVRCEWCEEEFDISDLIIF